MRTPQKKRRGRISADTKVFSHSFIKKSWPKRAQMDAYERAGFFNLLYITACGYAESGIRNYLKLKLSPLMPPNLVSGDERLLLPSMPMTFPDFRHRAQFEAVERILHEQMRALDKAPFAELARLHKTIVGLNISHVIGKQWYLHLQGLVSIRNLLAHGGDLNIELDCDGTEAARASTNFEKHPLENAIESLRLAKLFKDENENIPFPNPAESPIYRDEVVVHFWNIAVDVGHNYRTLAERNGAKVEVWLRPLDKL